MNYRMISSTVGKLLMIEALFMALPLFVSFYYAEGISIAGVYSFVMVILVVTGAVLSAIKPKNRRIFAKEGFVIVALSWIMVALFGSLPFYFSGAIPSFTDAFFETVSGLTTTGASILNDIEALPKSLLFWRSFTHWIGGMGVIVFVLAILPQKDTQSMHIMRAEVPGPIVGKLLSKTAATARILYLLYTAFTLLEAFILYLGSVPLFDSITLAFSTAGTGGFAIKNASIAAYNNLYVEIVISLFMIIFGINFNLFYLMLVRQVKRVLKSEELWVYLSVIAISTFTIACNILPYVKTFGSALRQAGFTVTSIISTTGFVTADFDIWPTFSKCIIVALMFVGGMAGSTGGGLKVARIIILFKSAIREIRRAVRPGTVKSIKLDGALIDKATVSTVNSYFILYMVIIGVSTILVSFNNLDFTSTVISVITCINNVGPGLNAVGPTCNFSALSDFTKLVLTADMLIGRLEIFPMLILFSPVAWKKNS
ncbi:MAG: TrkH family potassium uptake protein [Oscillospiraceae bacterium]|nr:TrkH family potassium uptake protein [Oscillospiraceae bacterium]